MKEAKAHDRLYIDMRAQREGERGWERKTLSVPLSLSLFLCGAKITVGIPSFAAKFRKSQRYLLICEADIDIFWGKLTRGGIWLLFQGTLLKLLKTLFFILKIVLSNHFVKRSNKVYKTTSCRFPHPSIDSCFSFIRFLKRLGPSASKPLTSKDPG